MVGPQSLGRGCYSLSVLRCAAVYEGACAGCSVRGVQRARWTRHPSLTREKSVGMQSRVNGREAGGRRSTRQSVSLLLPPSLQPPFTSTPREPRRTTPRNPPLRRPPPHLQPHDAECQLSAVVQPTASAAAIALHAGGAVTARAQMHSRRYN
ncbi:hypothetical protein EJ06DRAFT_341767 [Trichodelitschia bisporula]|uniref:Uncharacterized protein n=1 Tax=Trichodelitschia bisporula TaxID=703511 RepID=A0A6G1I2S3_9PEZI|nr:hypothetical protein EJ06DRAFT_341767 [Trichodelitschia bisporula]